MRSTAEKLDEIWWQTGNLLREQNILFEVRIECLGLIFYLFEFYLKIGFFIFFMNTWNKLHVYGNCSIDLFQYFMRIILYIINVMYLHLLHSLLSFWVYFIEFYMENTFSSMMAISPSLNFWTISIL